MSGESEGAERQTRFVGQATNQLRAAKQQQSEDPIFQLSRALTTKFGQNPQSMSPQVVAGMKANMTGEATRASQGAFNSARESAAASGAFRGGAQRGREYRISQQLGDTIAEGNRQIDTQAALQRNQDYSAALDAMAKMLGTTYQFDRDIANAYNGVATTQQTGGASSAQQGAAAAGAIAATIAAAFISSGAGAA